MSENEDFVRCPQCGNLNIRGTEKCIFCGAELEVTEEDRQANIETFVCPNCGTTLPVSANSCPICGWSKDAKAVSGEEGPTDKGESLGVPQVGVPSPVVPTKEPSTPPVPEAVSVPEIKSTKEEETTSDSQPVMPESLMKMEEQEKTISDKKLKKKGVELEEVKERSSSLFVLIFVLLSVLIGTFHYGIDFVISLATIKVQDPNIQLIPLTQSLEGKIDINALSIYLGVIVTILIGYSASFIIRKRYSESTRILLLLGVFVFVDMIMHLVMTTILTFAIRPQDILFSKIAGATMIFIVTNLITLFMPFVIGGYWGYKALDKIYFPKKYSST